MILFLSPMVPSPDGHGGSQRAAFVLDGLVTHGPVDYVQLRRKNWTNFEPFEYVDSRAASTSRITMPSVLSTSIQHNQIPWSIGRWIDLVRFGSTEAPRFSRSDLEQIANALPRRDFDVVCAGRLISAVVIDALLAARLITTKRKIVDLDDVTSKMRRRRLNIQGPHSSLNWRTLERIDERSIRAKESHFVKTWDAVSVCSDEDVEELELLEPNGRVFRMPNVIDRGILAESGGDGRNFLFVGAFNHEPNLRGLEIFLDEAWPLIISKPPVLNLTVVGMNAPQSLIDRLVHLGIPLYANVPSVLPYYEQCDAVISPILFGGGTRIKLLEAMALGRPIVSTSIGAEGLNIIGGRDAMVADTMEDFAYSMIALSQDPALRRKLVLNARAKQQESFGPASMLNVLAQMISSSNYQS